MDNVYTKYRQRLMGKMQEQPELRLMNRSIASMSQPFQELNNQLQSMLQQGNASPGARVSATLRGQQQLQDERSSIFSQALTTMEQRQGQLGDKFAEVSMKEAELHEQQKQEKADKQTNALRTGLQIAGMVAGIALAPATGGMSLMASAGLGASLGQMAGGFVGLDKNGNLTAKPEQYDTQAIMQGASSAIGTYAGHLNEKNMAAASTELAGALSDPMISERLSKMPTEQIALISGQLQYMIQTGNYDGMRKMVNGLRTPMAASAPTTTEIIQNTPGFVSQREGKIDAQIVQPTMPETAIKDTPAQQETVPVTKGWTYGGTNATLSMPDTTDTVKQGGQFSRNKQSGNLIAKISGSYYTVYDPQGNPLRVNVNDKVSVQGGSVKVEKGVAPAKVTPTSTPVAKSAVKETPKPPQVAPAVKPAAVTPTEAQNTGVDWVRGKSVDNVIKTEPQNEGIDWVRGKPTSVAKPTPAQKPVVKEAPKPAPVAQTAQPVTTQPKVAEMNKRQSLAFEKAIDQLRDRYGKGPYSVIYKNNEFIMGDETFDREGAFDPKEIYLNLKMKGITLPLSAIKVEGRKVIIDWTKVK